MHLLYLKRGRARTLSSDHLHPQNFPPPSPCFTWIFCRGVESDSDIALLSRRTASGFVISIQRGVRESSVKQWATVYLCICLFSLPQRAAPCFHFVSRLSPPHSHIITPCFNPSPPPWFPLGFYPQFPPGMWLSLHHLFCTCRSGTTKDRRLRVSGFFQQWWGGDKGKPLKLSHRCKNQQGKKGKYGLLSAGAHAGGTEITLLMWKLMGVERFAHRSLSGPVSHL